MSFTGTVKPALETFDAFIKLGKELAKLPALMLPQYQTAAKDLYEISQTLLTANENLSRWLFKFLYFDFRQTEARTNFLSLVRDYRTMKRGPEYGQLKFSCGDIDNIYHRNIAGKVGKWFSDRAKLAEVERVFRDLSKGDISLIEFIYDKVVAALEEAIDNMERCINAGSLDDAEKERLRAKAAMKAVTDRWDAFAGDLSELVIQFAGIAHVPVTLK